MIDCPICEESKLDTNGDELICSNCGATFVLEYTGMYEEGSNDRHDDGFEPEAWLEKYQEKVNNFKGE